MQVLKLGSPTTFVMFIQKSTGKTLNPNHSKSLKMRWNRHSEAKSNQRNREKEEIKSN